jgi:hypothetical protein
MAHAVKHGDLFEIPLPSGARALCRVVFKSEYFRNVVLIGVHGISGATDPQTQSEGSPLFTIYGSTGSLKNGTWSFIQRTSPRLEDVALSKRRVGGDLWIEDEHLGACTGDVGVPEMDVHGDRVLIKKVHRVLEG